MLQHFSTKELKRWIFEFKINPKLPFVTTSALIKLSELEKFVAEIKKQQADSVRVYFLRFSINDIPTAEITKNGKVVKGCVWKEAAPGITQATIAMVPAKNFRHDPEFVFAADDIVLEDQVMTLLPGIQKEGTGLNPPSPSIDNDMIG
jgi:hypothetical protein